MERTDTYPYLVIELSQSGSYKMLLSSNFKQKPYEPFSSLKLWQEMLNLHRKQ